MSGENGTGPGAAGPRIPLSEPDGYALLSRYGIPVPAHRVAGTAEEAVCHAEQIGYPVVMKVVSPQVIHKSDAGGVVTGISGPDGAVEAFASIARNVAGKMPGAEIDGVIVERQAPTGLELIVGGRTDPTFGKVITFGLGGTLVELLKDVSIRVLPVDSGELRAMIREPLGYRLISGFRGSLPLDEEALLSLLSGAVRMFSEGGVDEFDINPVILYPEGCLAVDARIYQGDRQAPEHQPYPDFDVSLLRPSSIAVIGATPDPHKVGYAVMRNLLRFSGSLFPVNPHHSRILGRKAYRSVSDLPGTVDWGVIAVPAAAVPGIMEELGRRGARLAIIVSSGFRESGPDGAILENEVVDIARKHGIRVIGPNCLGVILPHLGINTTFDPVSARAGHIGFVSQSGAVITTIVDWSIPEGIGFSAVISVGNQADLGFVDYLRYVASDPETKAIILYIEEIRDGTEFLQAVREITTTKPVIALKSGASAAGRLAASSHTGSLAGTYEVYQAAFRQSGIIPVFTLREAFDVAELIASEGYPEGNRAVVITDAGGFAVLGADYAESYGIALPTPSASLMAELDAILPPSWNRKNPLDIIGDGGVERFARVFDVMIGHQDEWDIAFVIAVPNAVVDAAQLAQEIARFSTSTHKMTVGCLLGGESMRSGVTVLRQRKIPNYPDIEDAFRAVGRSLHMARHCM